MGEPKIRDLTEEEFIRLGTEMGLSAEACARMIHAAKTRSGDVARSILAGQRIAKRSSVELIREERDRL
jgi:hypothetical protein